MDDVKVYPGQPLKTKKALGQTRYLLRHPLANNKVLAALKEKLDVAKTTPKTTPQTPIIKID